MNTDITEPQIAEKSWGEGPLGIAWCPPCPNSTTRAGCPGPRPARLGGLQGPVLVSPPLGRGDDHLLLAMLPLMQPRMQWPSLLARVQLLVHWDPSGRFCQAILQPASPQPAEHIGLFLPQEQDFALPFAELGKVPVDHFCQLVDVHPNGSTTTWCTDPPSRSLMKMVCTSTI